MLSAKQTAVLAAALLAVMLAPSSSEGASEVIMPCIRPATGAIYVAAHPRKCFLWAHNKQIDVAANDLRSLHWRGWGQSRARARGVLVIHGMGQRRTAVRLTVSRPRSGCQRRAYTRIALSVPANNFSDHWQLISCGARGL